MLCQNQKQRLSITTQLKKSNDSGVIAFIFFIIAAIVLFSFYEVIEDIFLTIKEIKINSEIHIDTPPQTTILQTLDTPFKGKCGPAYLGRELCGSDDATAVEEYCKSIGFDTALTFTGQITRVPNTSEREFTFAGKVVCHKY